jgi:TonB family protein
MGNVVLLAALAAAGRAGAAAGSVPCGAARPSLEQISNAEGLVIAPDGTIYFSQPFVGSNMQYLGRYRPPYDQPPETRWVDMGGNALGIALDPQRKVLYAGSRTLKKLLRVTLADPPTLRALADAEEGINGVTLGEDGAVYYSDQDGGHLYRVDPEGAKTRVTASPITEPNGIAFGPDGKLYVVSWKTTEVTRLDLANGAEVGRVLFATLPQVKGDGIAFDARGRLYATASSTLYEISPDGKEVHPLGRTAGANIEFGAGALACTDMYIAGVGQGIRRFQHDTVGLDVPWHRPAPYVASPPPPSSSLAKGMEGGVEGGVEGSTVGGPLGGVIGGTGTEPVLDYDQPPRLIKSAKPTYPPEAFEKKIEGTVLLEIVIDANGHVVRERVTQSIPLLDAAAIQAVRQWIFSPALRHGRSVTTVAHAPVTFRLDGPLDRATPPVPSPAPTPPAIAFPGQYAPSPPEWKHPVWPSGCRRFQGEEKAACLEFVAFDYGRLSRYAAANAALSPPRPGEARVVFFGDSITDNWSKEGYGGFFPGKPYLNRGIGGQSTSQMLLRFRADVIGPKPRVVVILAGTNDVAGNSGPVALEVIKQNLTSMAELARLHGVRVVLASLLPVSDDKRDGKGVPLLRTKDRPPESLRSLNTWMAEYARANGHVYLDYFSAMADAGGAFKPELNDDGLHPNAAGYAVMAPRAEKAIAQAVARR